MAKDRKILDLNAEPVAAAAAQQSAVWKQNTALNFTVEGKVFTVVDFENEMTALQDEDLIALVGDILPAAAALDDGDSTTMVAAFSLLIDNITNKAMLRRVLAILFLPESDRVYKRQEVEQRIEMLANLPNKQYLPLLESVKDFFVFVGSNFPNVSATFMGLKSKKTIAG
jgi:hypothetical protein